MSVLSIADAKAHLSSSGTIDEAELQRTINAAEAAIAKKTGPLEPTTVSKRLPGGGQALVLPVAPAISLTSITSIAGTVLNLSDLYLNPDSAVVSYVWGGYFASLAYDVVYQAGRSICPDDLLQAVGELVRHMWDSQRGPVRAGPLQSDALANTLPASAYTFPNRVTELIAPHTQLGFA